MIRLDDIHSLTEFQRNTREHIDRLKKTGRPEVLTINGQAELVVQDARSYQELLDRVERAEQSARLRRGIADYRTGRVRDIETALGELETRKLGKEQQSAGKHRAG